MVQKATVINWAKDLANKGAGVDYDGQHGQQCVDLVNWIFGKFFGKSLSGNAIDLLNSAKLAGYTVIYDSPNVNPKAGDIFVMSVPYHQYGHTGLVIEDSDGNTVKSIDQNVDGNADALIVGAPARYRTRPFNGSEGKIIGWIRPNYEETEEENDMFTISAQNRGIGIVTGGVFYALLEPTDPTAFWNAGVKNIQVSTKTFDNFQRGSVK